MNQNSLSLSKIYEGWEGYNTSVLHAIQPLTDQQITWRPRPKLHSVGELASHIAVVRIDWFVRMPAPGSLELDAQVKEAGGESAIAEKKDEIVHWLERSWQMVADTLNQWTVSDLSRTYRHENRGKVYLVSNQWTIWHILAHDIHHGGELALMLGMQGIEVPELGDRGGHLVRPPLASEE